MNHTMLFLIPVFVIGLLLILAYSFFESRRYPNCLKKYTFDVIDRNKTTSGFHSGDRAYKTELKCKKCNHKWFLNEARFSD